MDASIKNVLTCLLCIVPTGVSLAQRKEELADKVTVFWTRTFATSTQRSYSSHLRKYLKFCTELGFNPVPASQEQIELYIAYLSESLAYSSISKYLNIIRLLHVEVKLPNPLQDNVGIKALLRGVKRELGDTVVRKLPITPKILLEIKSQLNMERTLDIMFWAACVIGFHAMLRKSNLFPPSSASFDPDKHFARHHLHLTPWGLVLSLVWTKTIQFKDRVVTCPLIRNNGPLCPVAAITRVLEVTPEADNHSPMFVYLKEGECKTYLYGHFLRKLKEVMSTLGYPSTKYAGHSLRRGGATWALKCGVPSEIIKSMGDWKSSAYLNYLDINNNMKLKYARQMADCLPA